MNPTPGRRPDWVDDELFPFESRFVEVAGAHVHCVDEGRGPTLLLLHGNPTWSFLYRDVIRALRDRFRCVAPDFPGFGLSSAPRGYGFTAAEHAEVLEGFVEALDLTEVTPMIHDWAGPIGVAAFARHPERYRALVIGNTWAWPRSDVPTRVFSRTLGGPPGRVLIDRFNVFARWIVPLAHERRVLTDAEMRHYTGPFPDAAARLPTRVFPRELLEAEGLLAEAAAGVSRLIHLPALILWAARDLAFGEADRARWKAAFPAARTVTIGDAGHYLQDDAPEDVALAIRSWWREVVVDAPSRPG